jgi:hypothetical protein
LTDLKHRGVIKLSGTRTLKIIHRDVLEEGIADECIGRPVTSAAARAAALASA